MTCGNGLCESAKCHSQTPSACHFDSRSIFCESDTLLFDLQSKDLLHRGEPSRRQIHQDNLQSVS
jgi:hypothetical protein